MVFILKRSQAAMEFLMSYGWVLLAVLTVIASLVYFGVLDPETYLPERVDLKEGLDVVDASADENSISFILRNDLGRDVLDFQINATGCNNDDDSLSTPIDIPEGKTKKITIYCEHDYEVGSKIDSELDATWKTRTSTKGERYDFDHVTRGLMKINVNEGKALYDRVDVAACGTLNQTRTIYTLIQNLSASSTCLIIAADDIILNLAGYNISKDSGSGFMAGIQNIGYNNTIIANGTVSRFSYGLDMRENHNVTIENMTINQSIYNNIYLKTCTNSTVRSNVVASCTDATCNGIILYTSANDNLVDNNTIISNAEGIFIQGSYNNIISNNNVTSSRIYGIYHIQISTGNVMTNNYVCGSSAKDFYCTTIVGPTGSGNYFGSGKVTTCTDGWPNAPPAGHYNYCP